MKALKLVLVMSVVMGAAYLPLSCNKVEKLFRDPDVDPLARGIKTSSLIGYSSALVSALYRGEQLPSNVVFQSQDAGEYSGSGLLVVDVNPTSPVPFNANSGQLVIATLWDDSGTDAFGVMSVVLTDIDILDASLEFDALFTVPIKVESNGRTTSLFAEQDIVVGNGSDTLININLSRARFDIEIQRLNQSVAQEVFVAVQQNIWFVENNPNQTFDDLYDDKMIINGGGQIIAGNNNKGGVALHALINTEIENCNLNPTSGTGFMQNFQAGSSVDLGNILLNFTSSCNGKAFVEVATGEYGFASQRNVNLNLN